MFFVVGSRNSSNSVRLVEVAKKAGCNNSHLMHSEKEIPFNEIENSETYWNIFWSICARKTCSNFVG